MAYSNQDIVNFLIANPNLTDADLAKVMEVAGVSPAQIAEATGADEGAIAARVAATVPVGQAVLLGDTWVQPEYSVTGRGEDQQVGGITGVQTYKTSGGVNDQLPVGTNIQNYTPTGDFVNTSKTQKTESGFGEFLLGSAALFGGLGGGFEGLFGGAGADAAALAADADIAGGLIPEFGTNAAYSGFMTGAMTPEALAAMDALVAANPEIIGSGALLTDAAAGLTTTPTTVTTPTGGGGGGGTPTTTTTVPTTTTTVPNTVPTTTTTIPTNLSSVLTPAVVKGVTGLLGTTVLSRGLTPTTTNQTPVSAIPTQGVPLNSEDYFKAIQANYNQLLPLSTKDVATPLAAWYNSKYGA